MRRTKLLWFALGAGTSALLAIMTWIWNRALTFDDTRVVYLVLTEPLRKVTPQKPLKDEDMIAFNTGQMLRDCGARGFETTGTYTDHQATADFPVIPENDQALECIIKAIADQKIPFKVEMRWSSAVAREMRSKSNAQTH